MLRQHQGDYLLRWLILSDVLQAPARLTINQQCGAESVLSLTVAHSAGVVTLVLGTHCADADPHAPGSVVWSHPGTPVHWLTTAWPDNVERSLSCQQTGLDHNIVTIPGKHWTNLLQGWRPMTATWWIMTTHFKLILIFTRLQCCTLSLMSGLWLVWSSGWPDTSPQSGCSWLWWSTDLSHHMRHPSVLSSMCLRIHV